MLHNNSIYGLTFEFNKNESFLQFAASQNASVRAYNAIKRFCVCEYTPYEYMEHFMVCYRGRKIATEIINLQTAYVKTFDVAYQQVIEYIKEMRGVKYHGQI